MANRQWETLRTQGHEHVRLPVVVLPQGTGAPKLGEGDSVGSYFTVTRNSAGNLTLKTVDAYLAVVGITAECNSGATVKWGIPTQNADYTWSIPLLTASTSNAVALGAGTVTAGGSGYTSAPTIAYNNAHGNTGLKGTVTIAAGAVTAITITDGGVGTDGTAPTITLTGGGGTLATATVALGGAAADMPVGSQIHVAVVLRNSTVTP